MLRISDKFSLPVEIVTQTVSVLAKRRSGKSYLLARLAEELLDASQQVVILDPKGDWWGLRSSADGKGPGYPILILGGEHGDLPLDPDGGEEIARLAVEDRVAMLLDLSELRKNEVATFCAAFLETLYRLKAKEQFRTAMMLIVDEADAIAPQKPFPNEARMLGAIEDVVRRGGQRGIGCAMATQRAAVLNKNVLTQTEVMIALRLIAPQDIDAMMAWIDVHGSDREREQLVKSLPSLPVGTAWFWSPGWPTSDGIFEKVKVGLRRTFDSGATPKPGETKRAPKMLADVDLGAVKKRLAAAIERTKAEDPRVLRAEIAELKRQLEEKCDDVPGINAEALDELEGEIETYLDEELTKLKAHLTDSVGFQISNIRATIRHWAEGADEWSRSAQRRPASKPMAPPAAKTSTVPRSNVPKSTGTSGLSKCAHAILIAAAQRRPKPSTKNQLAIMSGYSVTSGGFGAALAELRAAGHLEGPDNHITKSGLRQIGEIPPMPTGNALATLWIGRLSKCEAVILEKLIDLGQGRSLSKGQLAEKTGYSETSGGFANALANLRTLELITRGQAISAAEEFFQ